jgi:hypothetical protein
MSGPSYNDTHHSDRRGEMMSEGYDHKTGLVLLLGRVEAKLDSALLWLQRHEEKVNEIDKRVDNLERNRAYIIGITLAVSVFITSVGLVLDPKDFLRVVPMPPNSYSEQSHNSPNNRTQPQETVDGTE